MTDQIVLRDEVIAAIEQGLRLNECDAAEAAAVYEAMTDAERGHIRVLIRMAGNHDHEIAHIGWQAHGRA